MKTHVLNEYPDGTKAADAVVMEIKRSLKCLKLQKLDGYLLHTPSYVYLAHVVEGLRKAKEEGLVSNIGVSVYDEQEALQSAELALDYIQIPSNVLDQRMDKTDFWNIAKKNSVTVFARSPFLQGLLVMEPEMSPAKVALLFSFVRSRAHHIVFGAESVEQVTENIATVQDVKEEPWMRELEENFKNIERAVVNPSLWSKIQA